MAVDTPSEVSKLYDAVQKYLDAVAGFHGDPASPLGEPQEYLNGIFLDKPASSGEIAAISS